MVIQVDVLQLLLNSAFTASIYLLSVIGFALIYSLEKFPNISQVQYFTFGAYMGLIVVNTLGLHFAWGLVVAFLSTGVLGVASYALVFRPMKKRGATPVHLIVGSVGYGLALMFIIQEIWGRDIQIYNYPFYPFQFGPLRLTWLWVVAIAFGVVISLSLHLVFTKTRVGKAIRATSNNPILASASGISTERVAIVVWFIGGALAGIGGVLLGSNIRVVPILGFQLLVPTIAVAVLGGLGNFYGVLGASLAMGLAENFSVPVLLAFGQPTDLRTVVAYAIVIAVLVHTSKVGRSSLRRRLSLLRRREHG